MKNIFFQIFKTCHLFHSSGKFSEKIVDNIDPEIGDSKLESILNLKHYTVKNVFPEVSLKVL